MLRERNEIIIFTRDDIERIVRYIAKERVAGSLFVGKFGEQSIRWLSDSGAIEVLTKYQEGDLHDLPASEPLPVEHHKKKKRR